MEIKDISCVCVIKLWIRVNIISYELVIKSTVFGTHKNARTLYSWYHQQHSCIVIYSSFQLFRPSFEMNVKWRCLKILIPNPLGFAFMAFYFFMHYWALAWVCGRLCSCSCLDHILKQIYCFWRSKVVVCNLNLWALRLYNW